MKKPKTIPGLFQKVDWKQGARDVHTTCYTIEKRERRERIQEF